MHPKIHGSALPHVETALWDHPSVRRGTVTPQAVDEPHDGPQRGYGKEEFEPGTICAPNWCLLKAHSIPSYSMTKAAVMHGMATCDVGSAQTLIDALRCRPAAPARGFCCLQHECDPVTQVARFEAPYGPAVIDLEGFPRGRWPLWEGSAPPVPTPHNCQDSGAGEGSGKALP